VNEVINSHLRHDMMPWSLTYAPLLPPNVRIVAPLILLNMGLICWVSSMASIYAFE